jgi:mannose-6-phosphate isomerase-like protein (cupin superfamily)
MTRAVIHLPGEGRVLDFGAFSMTVKAEMTDTSGELTVLEATELAGFGPPMHVHDDAGEAFYVLEGEYLIVVEEQEYHCPAGSFIYIPKGVLHGFRVGSVPSRKLNIYVPGAMMAYFDGLAAAHSTGATPDLVSLARASHMQVLGEVPEGYV